MQLNKLSSSARKIFSLVESRMLHNLNEADKAFLSLCYYRSAHEPHALDLLREFLDSGVNVDVKAAYGVTALNLICLTNTELNAIDILQMLLERGADPNNRSHNGATPLHMLIWVNRTETLFPMASLLISHGADVNARQENDENPLHKLLRFNRTGNLFNMVKLLVKSGTKINERGGRSKGFGSPLHILCENNQTPGVYDVVAYLVNHGALVTEKDDKNNTVLHVLCRFNQTNGLLALVRFLVQRGVDINAINDQGQTALNVLCQYNQSKHLAEVVQFFIMKGFDLSCDQPPVLSTVCKYNQTSHFLDVIKLLLESGANPNHVDHEGAQAIHYCAQYQKDHLVIAIQILENWGANLEALNNNRESLLHLASQYAGQLALFEFITSLPVKMAGRLANTIDFVGRTPLHLAARVGCIRTVSYLAAIAKFCVIDGLGKCVTEYLEDFVLNKGMALCLCCRRQNPKSLRELESVCKEILRNDAVFSKVLPQPLSTLESSIPKQIDHVYVYNKCDKLVRIHKTKRWKRFIVSWNENRKPDVNVLTEMASSKVGCNRSCLYRSCIRCNLLLSIGSYMRCLLSEIDQLDVRFITERVVFYGSSAERTKLFQLDEFDFLVVLSSFIEDERDPNNVIYCGDRENPTFLTHDDGRKGISSGRAIYYFYQLLRTVTKRVDHPSFHVKDMTFGETCATLYLSYSGCEKVLDLSVDITIGIARTLESQSVLAGRSLPNWCRLAPGHEGESKEILVPLRDKCGPPEWRVSFPSLERDSMLAAGKEVRACYRLLKLLVLVSQPKSCNETDHCHVPQKTRPSTYALKTCLFHYLEQNPPPWRKEDTISHCISVLEVYVTNPGIYLMSFFDSKSPVAYIDQEGISLCLSICNKLRAYLDS